MCNQGKRMCIVLLLIIRSVKFVYENKQFSPNLKKKSEIGLDA